MSSDMTRLGPSDGTLPVTSRDKVWAYTYAEQGTGVVVTHIATGQTTPFDDFDSARRWTHAQAPVFLGRGDGTGGILPAGDLAALVGYVDRLDNEQGTR